MDKWTVGDIVETKSGLWEITNIGPTLCALRNHNGRIHLLTRNELDNVGKKVEL